MLNFLVLTILLLANIFSYRLNNVAKGGSRWKNLPIQMEINSQNAGISEEAVTNAIGNAVSEWNTKTEKNIFTIETNDSLSSVDTIKSNGTNSITFSKNFADDSGGFDPYSVVAVGGQFGSGEEMKDAFVLFNAENIAWETDKEKPDKRGIYTDDLETITLHELGHVIGLGHSEVNDAVMSTDRSIKIKRTLRQDDIDGAQYLLSSSATGGSSKSTNASGIAGCASIREVNTANNTIRTASKNFILPILVLAILPLFLLVFIRIRFIKQKSTLANIANI